MSSVPFKGEFSFVNKTAENISSSDHRNAVAWHVMHRYEPYKRRRRSTAVTPEKSGESASTEVSTSPSSSEGIRPCPEMEGSPPWVGDLVRFAHNEIIPAVTCDPANYGGLLLSWQNLSISTGYDSHDKAYLALLATVMASSDPTYFDTARHLYMEVMAEVKTLSHADERLYAAVLSLFCVQTVLGHSDTARNLLKLLKNLMEANSSTFLLLNPSLRLDILSCDIFFALRHRTRPNFAAKAWSPGNLAGPFRQRLGLRVDTSELRDFSVPLEVMTALHELFGVRQKFRDAKQELQQWCRLRRLECLSRLADHQVNLTLYPHQYTFPAVELVVTNATLLLAVLVEGSPEPLQMAQSLLANLRESFVQLQQEHFASFTNVLRSVTDLGALAERIIPVDQFWFQTPHRRPIHSPSATDIFDYSPLRVEVENGARARTYDTFPGLYIFSDITWRLDEGRKSRPALSRSQSG